MIIMMIMALFQRLTGIATAGTSKENRGEFRVRLVYKSYESLGVSGRLAQCRTISWSGGQDFWKMSSLYALFKYLQMPEKMWNTSSFCEFFKNGTSFIHNFLILPMKCDGMFKLLRVEAATRTWCNLGRTSQSRWLSESPNKNLKDNKKKISSNCFCRCCFGWDYSQHHHFTPWDLGCNPDKPILFNYLWSIFREGAKNVFINMR